MYGEGRVKKDDSCKHLQKFAYVNIGGEDNFIPPLPPLLNWNKVTLIHSYICHINWFLSISIFIYLTWKVQGTTDVELSKYKSHKICYRVPMTSKLSHHALCIDVVYLKQKIVKTYSKQGAEMRSYVIGKHVFVLYHTQGNVSKFRF